MKKKLSLMLVTVILASVLFNSMCIVYADNTPKIKNVIFMIPDGGGFALYDFAKAVKEAGGFREGLYPNSTKITDKYMYLKDYLIGTETTYSASSDVTDSAAGGTALATGHKTNNNYVGVDPQGVPLATLLEAAQLYGKKSGIVATVQWSHATPGAFTAHHHNRGTYSIISEQVVNQGLDVVLGVGFGSAQWGDINEAIKRGYTITYNKTDLKNVKQGDKIWGNHYPDSIPIDINLAADQPNLAEMTAAAIRALDGTKEGFFLMVEGSKVDSGGHNNNLVQAVSEYIAFDEAFKVAVDFAKKRKDTIVIAAPDHDTGGLNLPDADEETGGNPNPEKYADAVEEVRNGINSKKGISWTTDYHTNRRCPVWMYAPEGIKPPEGLSEIPGDTLETRKLVIDNTEIAPYLAELMGLDLKAATDELFVDVTNLGYYDSNESTFTFYNANIKIKANQSVATVDGKTVDLGGKIAVYSSKAGRFYVPKALLSIKDNKDNIEVKTIKSKDVSTGKVLVKGQLDKAYAGKRVTLLLAKKDGNPTSAGDIGYVDQAILGSNGEYVFKFTFDDDVEQYELKMYLGDKTVTDSVTEATASYSWLDTMSVLTLEDDTVISNEVLIKNHYEIEGLTYLMVLAFYDHNNKLMDISKSNMKEIMNEITHDQIKSLVPEGTKTVKSVIWSNYTKIIPLCKEETITVQ